MKTSARLLKLLTVLQTKREWTGAELSERLGVDVRTLRRDVTRLRELGYEISSSAGLGGGYRFAAGRQLPPLHLDDEDAVTIGVALGAGTAGLPQLRERALAVLVKLEQLLPARLRRRVRALQSVTLSMSGAPVVDPALLTALAAACQENERVTFSYVDSRGAKQSRTVEPLKLANTGRVWYLLAWDIGRADWRTFRVDRMDPKGALSIGPRFIPRPPPVDAAAYISRSISVDAYEHEVRLKLKGRLAELAKVVPSWVGVLEPLNAESCVLSIGGNNLEALVAQIVLAGVDFELLEPKELAAGIQEIGRRLVRGTERVRS